MGPIDMKSALALVLDWCHWRAYKNGFILHIPTFISPINLSKVLAYLSLILYSSSFIKLQSFITLKSVLTSLTQYASDINKASLHV